MNRDEAKAILRSYRPGVSSPDDPLVAEALEQARQDSDLAAWFEQEVKLDDVIRRKLAASAVPADLVRRIHASVASRRAMRRRTILAMAACLALAALLAGLWMAPQRPGPGTAFAACRSDMAGFLQQFPKLDFETERPDEMRQWLARQHALAQVELPAALERFPGIGCRTVDWRGKKLALLCFMVDGEVVHLFVLPAADFPGVQLDETPQWARTGRMSTASWKKGGVLFLALTPGSESFLQRHL